jgi:hypothetical protein
MTLITKRFLSVIAFVLATLAAGLLIELLLSFKTGWQFGHTQSGHIMGWLGLAVILLIFGYSIKKRYGAKSGWPKGWFRVHQAAGIMGPLLIFVHAGPHFHALVPFFALIAMGIVMASGVIGVFVHRKAVSMLNTKRKELLSQELTQEEVQDKLFDLASDEETFRIWQTIHVPMVMIFVVLTLAHVGGALYFGGL